MYDDYISKSAVIAISAWLLAIGLVGSVWVCVVVANPDPVTMAAMLATAALSAVGAAVWQIRIYVSRLSALIRVTAGLESERGHGLQSVR